ncbi:MAG: hydroxyacylglutathione hydrolase [Candidatus Puniceispirillales bacterium]
MSPANLIRVPALDDNYIWMLHNPSSNALAVIDPADAAAVMGALEEHGLEPTEIVNTHHHADHTAGNGELMERFGIPLIAPASETARIDNITQAVADGETITIAGYDARVFETPGHTTGHIGYFLPDCFGDHGLGLVGDTLFALGCGRVFEGSMDQMWQSMLAVRGLPENTVLACGHEYSAANALYVESLGWPRDGVAERIAEIRSLRADNTPTLPTRLSTEAATNPFLNCDDPALAGVFGLSADDPVAVFTALRQGKDNFKG